MTIAAVSFGSLAFAPTALAEQSELVEAFQAIKALGPIEGEVVEGAEVPGARAVEAAEASGEVSTQSLISDPDYYVFDFFDDDEDDSETYPELTAAALTVPKTLPSLAGFYALTESQTYGDDSAALFLDVDGDDTTDFKSLHPDDVDQDVFYETELFRFDANDEAVDTGHRVTWLRESDGYLAVLPWQAAGITQMRWVMYKSDDLGFDDAAPDDFAEMIPVAQLVTPR